jgi:hypothetical protein
MQALRNYVDELVGEYGAPNPDCNDKFDLRVHDLPDMEREKLTCLYIEAHDRDLDYMIESVRNGDMSINSEYNCALLDILKENNADNRDHFAQIVISNIRKYHEENLQHEIDACVYLYRVNSAVNKGFSE